MAGTPGSSSPSASVSADLPPMPVAAFPVRHREAGLGTSGAELSAAHKLKRHNRNLGVGTSCLGTWLKLSRAAQAGNRPRPYTYCLSCTRALVGFCVMFYPMQQS